MASSAITNVGGSAGATGPAGPTGPTGPGNVATDSIFDAKGDVVAGTGADTAARVPVGTDGQALVADSTAAAGVKWATPAGGGGGGGAAVAQVGYDAIGANWETLVANRVYCKQIVLGTEGTLLGVAAYLRPSSDNLAAVDVMVMADNAGAPGVLLAAATATPTYLSNSGSMPGAGRWYHVPVAATLPAGTYWIAITSASGFFDIAYDAGTDRYFTASQFLATGAYPSAWAITTGARKYSLRAALLTSAASSVGGLALIQDALLLADAASFDFTGIAQGYKNLQIVAQLRGTNAAAQVVAQMRFNGDSGANYDWQQLYGAGGTAAANGAQAVTFTRCGLYPGASTGATLVGSAEVTIPNYTGATFEHPLSGTAWYTDATTQLCMTIGGRWKTAAAINRITITPDAGNWKAGSRIQIYGMA